MDGDAHSPGGAERPDVARGDEPRRWKGVKIARRGPGRFTIVTQLPSGLRVSIPLGRFTGRRPDAS